jgi:hypothetical protein
VRPVSTHNAATKLLLLIAVVFYGLCFFHLRADFPNHSPWNDWSKMTDEGWYGVAAAQHFLNASWLTPGSFNPAVAMPVWPLALRAWFGLTGIGMVPARALMLIVYGTSLALLLLTLRQRSHRQDHSGTIPALAIALMAVNPFCYAFDRLAVLEPGMVFWLMLGLWLAGRTGPKDIAKQIGLGIILCLLVLTKTTGIFLVPAVLYQLAATVGWTTRTWIKPTAVAIATALLLWLVYYALVVRPHYLEDYRLLFTINQGRVHLSIIPRVAFDTLWSGIWINRVLYPAALLVLLLSAIWLRDLWQSPLFGSSVIAIAGYLLFICYHSNLQPRYYLVITMPVVIVLLLGFESLWAKRPPVGVLLAAAIGLSMITMAIQTIHYVMRPEYSFAQTADAIAAQMRQSPETEQTLLSSSGADITLLAGIPSLSSEYTTHGLEAVLDRYKPGWYAAWEGWDDERTSVLRLHHRLDERARYTVFDDPKRQTLVLYRMQSP